MLIRSAVSWRRQAARLLSVKLLPRGKNLRLHALCIRESSCKFRDSNDIVVRKLQTARKTVARIATRNCRFADLLECTGLCATTSLSETCSDFAHQTGAAARAAAA